MNTLPYGTEHFGRLKTVMLHRPTHSIQEINSVTMGYYLFDAIPNPDHYLEEHDNYRKLLQAQKVLTLELSDNVHNNRSLMNTLASLPYLHDSSVISNRGAIISQMGGGRHGEEVVVREALTNLGVPVAYEFSPIDHFEGCLILPGNILLIACTERHRRASIEKFLPVAVSLFTEVIYVECPKARRFMHADMVYGQVSDSMALAFLPAFLDVYSITSKETRAIDFIKHMSKKNIEIINLSDQEQKTWGCSFVPLEPNLLIHYDIALSAQTRKVLHSKGVEIIEVHPNALLAGGGSLRCLTLQLFREGNAG
ncbi:amidinotransferase [Lucifera butyrica]|uniref:Amidinotransferase n=1 Tax=Lucifera butyrica TaxID=1351585 RepID=A0A498R503_9FIRM|nr:arginine deiminase family protein [Lucifera butyrica]VBB05890.1 amidinotransferase [Lucifera butyrica]